MLPRRDQGQPPQFTFTSDFHQLAQGDRLPGRCRLRYDPFRIVPRPEFPSAGPVRCYVKLWPLGRLVEMELPIPHGALKEYNWDPSGQGFMLEYFFELAEEADEVECWFSYRAADGRLLWDSAGGANFHLRFPLYDLRDPAGRVVASEDPAFDRFEAGVSAIPAVESIDLRWRTTYPAAGARQVVALTPGGLEEGLRRWNTPAAGVPVPEQATLVYDLVYRVGGRSYTDDNSGSWYLAEP